MMIAVLRQRPWHLLNLTLLALFATAWAFSHLLGLLLTCHTVAIAIDAGAIGVYRVADRGLTLTLIEPGDALPSPTLFQRCLPLRYSTATGSRKWILNAWFPTLLLAIPLLRGYRRQQAQRGFEVPIVPPAEAQGGKMRTPHHD
jgi:hypothetical protein